MVPCIGQTLKAKLLYFVDKSVGKLTNIQTNNDMALIIWTEARKDVFTYLSLLLRRGFLSLSLFSSLPKFPCYIVAAVKNSDTVSLNPSRNNLKLKLFEKECHFLSFSDKRWDDQGRPWLSWSHPSLWRNKIDPSSRTTHKQSLEKINLCN